MGSNEKVKVPQMLACNGVNIYWKPKKIINAVNPGGDLTGTNNL